MNHEADPLYKSKNGELSAHPVVCDSNLRAVATGLTKREHFAAKAMQGQLSDNNYLISAFKLAKADNLKIQDVIAISSVEYADALLKALEK